MRVFFTRNYTSIFCIVALLFCAPCAFSQLGNFSFTVTKTDETCTGNGALTFTATGTTPGASLFYSVYLLPDSTNPIAVVNTSMITGLSAGNYRVVALQTLGSLSNSQQRQIAILDNRTPLIFQVDGHALNCQIGTITVNVTQGNPVSYEIISGPVLIPAQTSNVFNDMPLGQYTIKVTDACGDVLIQANTLVYVHIPENIFIDLSYRQECGLLNCTTKPVNFIIDPDEGLTLAFPFDYQVTVLPPDGSASLVFNQTIHSYAELLLMDGTVGLIFNLPFFNGTNYFVNIKVTDPCGYTTEKNGVSIYIIPRMSLAPQYPDACFKELKIYTCNILMPYTIQFLSAPSGFNPADFIANPLGPFYTESVQYLSDAAHELPDGDYFIKLTDACGRVFQDHLDVKNSMTTGIVSYVKYTDDCVPYYDVVISDYTVNPATLIISQAPPNFDHPVPYDSTSQINSFGVFLQSFTIPGDYTFTGVNVCGRTFEVELNIPITTVQEATFSFNDYGCTSHGRIRIKNSNAPPTGSILITQAPPGYPFSLPHDVSDTTIDNEHPTNDILVQNLPSGDYTIQFADVCGHVYPKIQATVPVNLWLDPPIVSVLEGCEIGYGSLSLSFPGLANVDLEKVIILTAPSNYTPSLPYDVSFNIAGLYGSFYMNSLPQGIYTFYTKDTCGTEHTFTVEIGNHYFDTTAEVEGYCGSFNLFIHNSITPVESNAYFVLQKFNPINQIWTHPITNFPFQPGSYPNGANSYLLGASNYNITSQGTFRILKLSYIYSNGNSNLIPCIKVLKEFEFLGVLKITNAYKISCLSGSSQVLIQAGDTNPLTYKITSKNAQPFFIDNGNSNIFNGLLPGIYNFQVQDGCGNIVNRLFDVSSLAEPVVTSSNLCNGQIGQLSVAPFSFLSYQWWKGDDSNTILSTSNVLPIAPFLLPTSLGTYHVRVYSESVFSCIDTIITYVIPEPTQPNAGEDYNQIICSANALNLNSLLTGAHDANGSWSEVSNSGMLNGNVWLPVGIAAGVYLFKYTVYGFCDAFDEAIVIITLHEDLPNPTVNVADYFCTGDAIQFEVNDIPNAEFQWTGPDNFTSQMQNPMIANVALANSGNYIVKATVDVCESSTNVPVIIHTKPEFEFNLSCIEGNFTLSIVPKNTSFNINDVDYYWTGPKNFTSTVSSVILNDLAPGTYSATVTTADSCMTTQTIPIQNTRCVIPAGISPNGDQHNQSFDLTGFDILNLKIFSRYGNIVYERKNYTNQWHGQDYNDHELPDATYYYYIQFKSGEQKTGWVYVTR